MLRDTIEESSVEVESAPTWAGAAHPAPELDWRVVDRALRAIRRRRAALDADEARWLRAAEQLQIWRPLGMVSALDYLERVLGYAPRTAQDRLRVARALGALPGLTAALASDDLPYSAVRELTRVATPATEGAWLAAAAGKNLREIEELVADHRPGDRPDDPPDPEARMRVVRFELSSETFALLRQARTALDHEHGTNLADDEFVAAMCSAVLDGSATAEPTGRAKFQVAVTVCERCRQGWQEGAGVRIAIDSAAVERAMCDAQHIGSLDGDEPERAHQDIAPSVVRFVWRRDGGRCRVPGCRSARGLEVHHVVHRADGGGHEAENLCLLCSSCHLAHHRGALAIRGTAEHLEVRWPGEPGVSSARRPAHGSTGTIGAAAVIRDGVHLDAARLAADLSHAGGVAPSAEREDPVLVRTSERGPAGAGSIRAGAGSRGASKFSEAALCVQAKTALATMGWKPAIARAAVDAAIAAHGGDLPLDRLVIESLRRCPVPKA
jgi:hypothetical protein